VARCGIAHLLHDRDTKYTPSFRAIIASGQVEPYLIRDRDRIYGTIITRRLHAMGIRDQTHRTSVAVGRTVLPNG
jgi:hypothetical protein